MAESAHPKTGTPHKRVGSVVRGKYRVEAFLATGTMANVYAATHRNGAKVALKILHKQLAEDPSLCERFKREGYFANSIGHPGVVRAIDDDVTEDGCPFLVMELLEGETLGERRRRKGGKLSVSWLMPVADSLLEVLAAAHAREVVHRDLKPDNVFVTKSGEVKVLDFGVARWNDGKSSSDMTAVGMVLGTPAYMPPEQALGRREDVDAQSDLWAVGATLFVVLSGESVHEGGDAKAKLIATARTAARPLREAAPEVPRAVAAVIDRALAFHKQERWPDANAMREALRWARLSLEDRPSDAVATAASQADLEVAPPPVPTRRLLEEEPTLLRKRPMSGPPGALPALTPDGIPASTDFLTSAPPITLRDVPRSTAAELAATSPGLSTGEPVFPLRREKEGERPPTTERLPNLDPGAASEASPLSSETLTRTMEVNLGSTRPMAAMTLPTGQEPPRLATDAPAVDPPPMFRPSPEPGPMFPTSAAHGPSPSADPSAHPSAHPSAPPSPELMFAPTAFAPAPPASAYASAPPAAYAQLPTAPSMRVQARASGRPPGVPEAPGPLLAGIVEPTRGRTARIVVPLLLALAVIVGVGLVLRARAANPRAGGAQPPAASAPVATAAAQPAASGAAGTAGTGTTGATAAAGAASSPSSSATPGAPDPKASPAVAGSAPSAAAAPPATTATTEVAKKAKPKRKKAAPKAPPAEPAASEPASASTTAPSEPPAAPAPAAAPPAVDTTPKDALPTKEPESAGP